MAIVTRTPGTTVMPEYRAYIIGSNGHFCDAIALNCDNDEAASQRVDNLASAEAVDIELWQGARMVATISRKKQPTALAGFSSSKAFAAPASMAFPIRWAVLLKAAETSAIVDLGSGTVPMPSYANGGAARHRS
jgi:hypothetical protein